MKVIDIATKEVTELEEARLLFQLNLGDNMRISVPNAKPSFRFRVQLKTTKKGDLIVQCYQAEKLVSKIRLSPK